MPGYREGGDDDLTPAQRKAEAQDEDVPVVPPQTTEEPAGDAQAEEPQEAPVSDPAEDAQEAPQEPEEGVAEPEGQADPELSLSVAEQEAAVDSKRAELGLVPPPLEDVPISASTAEALGELQGKLQAGKISKEEFLVELEKLAGAANSEEASAVEPPPDAAGEEGKPEVETAILIVGYADGQVSVVNELTQIKMQRQADASDVYQLIQSAQEGAMISRIAAAVKAVIMPEIHASNRMLSNSLRGGAHAKGFRPPSPGKGKMRPGVGQKKKR